MSESLLKLLGRHPDGSQTVLSKEEVAKWCWKRIGSDDEKKRRERHQARHDLYRDAGDELMERYIDEVFNDPEVKRLRKQWVSKAKFNNVLRRLVNELACVYQEPARRMVDGDEQQKRYDDVQRMTRQHELAARWGRYAMLHRAVAVGFRVRDEGAKGKRPKLDVVTPAGFCAIADPNDPTRLIALAIQVGYDGPLISRDDSVPRWVVWSDFEVFRLTKNGHLITESWLDHGMLRMPWVLLAIEPPDGCLMDDTTGDDLRAAHEAVWFENILLLKESKSATNQSVLQGDVSKATRDQVADSEHVAEIPEGATFTTADRSMDLALFRETGDHIVERAAANYGVPAELLKHAGATSGWDLWLRRIPLRELRRMQEVPLREFERELAEVQVMVLDRELPELSFGKIADGKVEVPGWSIDFGESQVPLSPMEQIDVFAKERAAGLTSTIAEMVRRNPDLSPERAQEILADFIADEVLRNGLMRPLQEMSGSMGAEQPDGGAPQRGPITGGDQVGKPKRSIDELAQEVHRGA